MNRDMKREMKAAGIKAGSVLLTAAVLAGGLSQPVQGAIALDRTRAIFPGSEKGIVLNISNDSQKKPYLAQAWLEDAQGKKLTDYLVVTPPMQRVEAGGKSVIRIAALPSAASLPQDRESLFWFSVREVPPKSDRPNVMQVALQTRIKVFYRPAGITPERYSRQDEKLVLHKTGSGYRVENPTPYYMTVIGVTGGAKQRVPEGVKPVMIAPKSSATVGGGASGQPWLVSINDFGGRAVMPFRCQGSVCQASPSDSKAG